MSPDVAASVRARLLNLSKAQDAQFEFVLVRYACERFLYRLGASDYRSRCLVKGATLLTLWMKDPYRATRDVDLLATGASDEASVRAMIAAICSVPCPEDGIHFDLETLGIEPIRGVDEYSGQRAILWAQLGSARIRFQLDIGFGDAVTPGPQDAAFPTLIAGVPAPAVRAYPRTVSIAEKFEAMVKLGEQNSRMKDFHDIWALAMQFPFDGAELRTAVAGCFKRRQTEWTTELPLVLGATYYAAARPAELWGAYVRREAFRAAPPASFEQVGEVVRAFLGPIRESIVGGAAFRPSWAPGGPWS